MIEQNFWDKCTVMEAVSKYVNRPNLVEDIARHMDSELGTSKLETRAKGIEEVLKALDSSEELQYNILSQIGLNRRYKISSQKSRRKY